MVENVQSILALQWHNEFDIMSFSKVCTNIREMASEISNTSERDPDKIAGVYKECNLQLRRMYARQKIVSSIAEKRHIASSIAIVTSCRTMLKKLKKTGRGVPAESDRIGARVRWEDTETAFKSR